MNSTKPYGIRSGTGMIILGVFLGLVNYLALTFSDYYFPKLFIAAGTFVGLGIGMIILPGSVIPNDTPNDKKVKLWWSTSPILHRIVWIVSGLAGLAVSFYIMLQIDPNFI